MRAAREAWFETQPDLDHDKLVFLDETAAATNMARRYGRAPRGERRRLLVPQGHYKTTTVTAALCALDLADGATNGERFRDYVASRSKCWLMMDSSTRRQRCSAGWSSGG